MGTTNYISLHGMIWGEVSDSGVVRSYCHHAIGSVTETYSGTGTLENTYRYKPYGSTLAKTGSAADPSFLWNGGSGYRATSLINSDYYVVRRHFSTASGNWTSEDPLWPSVSPYGYVNGRSITIADPSGLSGEQVGCCFCVDEFDFKMNKGVDWNQINGKPQCGKDGDYVGDYFKIKFWLVPQQCSAAESSVPSFEWWECSDQPPDSKGLMPGSCASWTKGSWCQFNVSASVCPPNDWQGQTFGCAAEKIVGYYADQPSWTRASIVAAAATWAQTHTGKVSVRNLFILARMSTTCPGCVGKKRLKYSNN